MDEKRLHRVEQQYVDISDIELDCRILDIGGGGEGIIGQLKGEAVISIDPDKTELKEAPCNSIKIVMSVEDLKFVDETFDTVTSFFTLMYIDAEKHEKVISEVHKVLKTGGCFIVWDVTIPVRNSAEKDIYVIPLQVKMKEDYIVDTGYGVLWTNRTQDMKYYSDICRRAGFRAVESLDNKDTYFVRLIK
ncbi:MAG: class I SAM-dependent methyltransferase [Clostridia bacterium]